MIDPVLVQRRFDANVVIGVSGEEAGLVAPFEQHGAELTEVPLVEGPPLFLAEDGEHFVAPAAFGQGYDTGHLGGGRVGPFGVGKDVQVADVEFADEAVGFQKILLRLAGEADDQVDPDRRVGHSFANPGYAPGVELPGVAAAHLAELLVIARL